MSRLISWFSTKTGKIFTRCCVGTAALGVFANQIAINGPLLDKLQSVVQAYRHGKPRPLSPKMNSIVKEVLQDCTLKPEEKQKLKFFYVVGYDLFHAGGINSPWGSIIGIPFTFEDINDINFGELRMAGRETVDWVIDGQDLIKALTISDNAKKFALMREIHSCDFSHILQNGIISSLCILIPARVAQMVNTRLNTFEKFSFKKRSFWYLGFYSLGFLLYRCFKDPLKHLSDKEADRLAAETGPDYLNGGIEYYKKALMRNKELREMLGSKFKSKFDEHGNENYILFAPKMPVAKRLDNLRNMKKEKIIKAE